MASISSNKRALVYLKTQGKCVYCGMSLSLSGMNSDGNYKDVFHVDHVISKDKGGGDNIENLVPCCQSCNSTKFNRNMEEFRVSMMKKNINMDFSLRQILFLINSGIDIFSHFGIEKYLFWFEKEGIKI